LNYQLRQIIRFPGRLVSELIWGFQRAFRGYSDRDWWSIDSHIAEILSKSLIRYVEKGHTVPVSYFKGDLNKADDEAASKEWDKAKEIRDAEYEKYADFFARYADGGVWASEEAAEELNGVTPAQYEEAMQWLAEHFTELWD
jgi:hypothetical protein